MTQIFIHELADGFWKDHRPAGHGEVWRDVEVLVSENGELGPVGFEVPRNYNFLNLDFSLPREAELVAAAKTAKPTSNFKSVKKELIELGRIVGSRLKTREGNAVKLFRGNHKPGTETVSSARARLAAGTLTTAATVKVSEPKPAAKTAVKKTVTKAKTSVEDGVTTQTTSSGALVRRVAAKVESAKIDN